MEKGKISKTCSVYEEMGDLCNSLLAEPHRKKPLGQHKNRQQEIRKTFSVYDIVENLYNNLVAIPHRKRSLGKHRNRWAENVKMGVTNQTVNVSTALNHLRNK